MGDGGRLVSLIPTSLTLLKMSSLRKNLLILLDKDHSSDNNPATALLEGRLKLLQVKNVLGSNLDMNPYTLDYKWGWISLDGITIHAWIVELTMVSNHFACYIITQARVDSRTASDCHETSTWLQLNVSN